MKTVRVMLASPSPEMLRGLRQVMDSDRRIEVVATARSGEECERMARVVKPHILVVDLHLGDIDAGLVIRRMSRARLETAVLVCSQDAVKGSPPLEDAVSAGAFDFVLCPQEVADLSQIDRQILTQIFVAAFSKTKQIPQAAEGASKPAADTAYKIDGILFDCAAERVDEARELVGGLRPRGKPMILAVLRQPPPAAAEFAQSVQGTAGRLQVGVARGDEALTGGAIFALDQMTCDVTMARERPGGPVRLSQRPQAQGDQEPGPSAAPLYEGFARTYGAKGIVVLLGLPRADSLAGLVAVRQVGGHSIIEKQSRAALAQVRTQYAGAAIPDGIFTAEQIQGLINGILKVNA